MKKKNFEIECGILRTLLLDRESMVVEVPEAVFQFPSVSEVFKYVQRHYREKKKLPPFKTLEALFPDSLDVVASLREEPPTIEESGFYLEEIRKRWTESVVLDFDPERLEDFYTQVEVAKSLTMAEVEDGHRVNFIRDTASLVVEEVETIPTGLNGLDRMIGGGSGRGRLGVILSLPKMFKTGTLVNFGKAAFLAGYRALYVSLEIPSRFINQKAELSLFGQPFMSMDPDRASRMMRNLNRLGGDFETVDFRPNTLTIPALRSIVMDYRPDVVLVDYAELLKPETRYAEMRHTISEQYLGLKAVAEESNSALWTVSLAHRKAVGRKTIREDNVGEDFKKVAHCDYMASLNQTDEEKEASVARLVMVANRWGPPDGSVFLEIDYARVRLMEVENVG